MDDSTSETNERYLPTGWHTVTPRIVVTDPKALIDFLRRVFEATGDEATGRPSVITIGDSHIMISETGIRGIATAFLYVYVKDVDAAYRRALDAGAHSLEPPLETPYGDRRCMVEDKWGNTWQIATYGSSGS